MASMGYKPMAGYYYYDYNDTRGSNSHFVSDSRELIFKSCFYFRKQGLHEADISS